MTETTTHLSEALTDLFGGQAGPFVLRDQSDEPLHLSSLDNLAALLEAEPEPYIDPIADDLVHFVYQHVAEFVGAFACLALPPSLVLVKGDAEFRFYVFAEPLPRGMVEPLAQAMGCDLDAAAPLPGSNGWVPAATVTATDKKPELTWLSGAVFALADLLEHFSDAAPAPAVVMAPVGTGLKHRDAVIRTVFDYEDPCLQERVTVSGGRQRAWTDWKPDEKTRGAVLDIFCRHNVAADKDGPCVVLGKLPPGKRLNERVESMWFVGLDYDSHVDGDVLSRAIADTGLMSVMASTHSHLKTKTVETWKSFANWMVQHDLVAEAEDAEVTLEVVRARMASAPKNLAPEIVETMTFEVTGEGDDRMVEINHAPIQKWRVIFALDRAFIAADHKTDDLEGYEVWRGIPRAMAKRLGLRHDPACVDMNRLWYLPSHPEERPDFRIDLFGGKLVSLDDLLAEAALLTNDEDEDDADLVISLLAPGVDPDSYEGRLLAEYGGGARKTSDGQVTGPFDARWAKREAHGFDIVKLLKAKLPKNDKRLRGMRGRKLTIQCPFSDDHSTRDTRESSGCFAVDAGEGKGDGFTISCSHAACHKRDRLKFLNKMVADKWFTVEDAREFQTVEHDVEVVQSHPTPATAPTSPATAKPKPAVTTGYPLPKAAGKFELTEVDGRKFYAFPPDDEGKGGGLAFSRFTLVGGAVHPDRGNHRDVEIEFENEHGVCETMRIPADKIANKSALIAMMRDLGIAFGSTQGETVAHRILMMNQPTNHTVRDKTGWLEGRDFLLPTGVFLGEGDVRLSDIKRIDADPTAGTLEGWKTGAAAACAADSPSLHAGLLAGFAGPLTGLTGHATLVIAFTGSTTEGKTWRQQCGVAVSGPPEPGVGQMKSMNSTVGALEVPIERGSCTIAAFDELQHADAEEVQDLIFRATGQQGRARLSQSGGAGLTRAWRGGVVTLSTETSLAQQLRLAGARMAGGMTVRLIEVDVTIGRLGDDEWDKANAMLANHGHALPVLIEEIRRQGYVENPSELGKRVKAFTQKLPDTDSPVAMRAATAIGYLCVGGEIAKTAGLLPMSFDVDAVGRTLWEGALGSGVKPEDPINRAIETLLESVNTRRHEIYEDDDDRFQTREAVAWVSQYAPTGEKVYCLREKFLSKWSGGAADEKALKKALLDRGIAIPRVREKTVDGKIVKSNLSVWRTWKKPVGTTPVIVLKASAIDGEDAPIPIGG